MPRLLRLRRLVPAFALLAACNSAQYSVSVDAIARPGHDTGAKTYYLQPGEPGVSEQDLLFLEVRSYADEALAQRGFERAASREAASLLVLLSYDLGPAITTTWKESKPVWGDKGVTSQKSVGSVNPWSGKYEETTTYQRERGIVGHETVTKSETLYPRVCTLSAFAADEVSGENPQPVWTVHLESRGESDDLRRVLPALLYASVPYIEESTDGKVKCTVRPDSKGCSEFIAAARDSRGK